MGVTLLLAVAGCGPDATLTEELSGEELVASSEDGDASVAEAALSSTTVGAYIRATAAVNLRTGPGTGYPVVLVVPLGGVARVVSATPSNGFFKITYSGHTGWSFGQYWQATTGGGAALIVNGYTLTATEAANLRYVAAKVVPYLAGDRATRLTVAARVSWWSLKEGIFGIARPASYSNCHYASGDARIGPLTVCPSGAPWQVGIAAVQVPGMTLSSVTSVALARHPGLNAYDVLWRTATDAGYTPGGSTHNAIVNSWGDLRKSWLLRDGATGFTFEEPAVTRECINASYGWCYGTGWTTTARYAPNRTAAMRAIADVRGILASLAP